MLVGLIIACEILFWALLLAGLGARYLLRHSRLSSALLVSAPLVDLLLLAVSIIDLRRGGSATAAHTVAAIYLGVSVGSGTTSSAGLTRGSPTALPAARRRLARRGTGAPTQLASVGSGCDTSSPGRWVTRSCCWPW